MQRPNTLVITTNTTAGPYPLDRYVTGYAMAIQYSKPATMTATCRIQQSFMDPYQKADGTPYTVSYAVSGFFYDMPGFTAIAAASAINIGAGSVTPLPRAVQLITSSVSGGSVAWSLVPYGMDAN